MTPIMKFVRSNALTGAPQTRVSWSMLARMSAWQAGFAAVAIIGLMSTAQAASEPSQLPLLSNASGAKPNLMLTIDNSGSMGFSYGDGYQVASDDEIPNVKICPSPYSNVNSTTLSSYNAGIGGDAIYDVASGTNTCYERYSSNNKWRVRSFTDKAVDATPARYHQVMSWSAQRSSEVNPIYYNPRVTYLPRVDSEGNPVALNAADKVAFVSNTNSANFRYQVSRDSSDNLRVFHSMYADDAVTVNMFNTRNVLSPSGYTQIYNLSYSLRIPEHVGYTAAGATLTVPAPTFTYTVCTDINGSGTAVYSCNAATKTTVTWNSLANITLPSDHQRTDCSAAASNLCTTAEEIKNILNWYRYYSVRFLAASTAIGQALANKAVDGQVRVGYANINRRVGEDFDPLGIVPGGSTTDLKSVRGVRLHEMGKADANQIYTWLYDQQPGGGTPLHNSLDKVAEYYRVNSDAKENPWAVDPSKPSSSSNEEMTCRRSFNLLFSDGAWNKSAATNTSGGTSSDADNTDKSTPYFTRLSGSTYGYQHEGLTSVAGRKLYTPYPSTSYNSLADLSAYYFWHQDLRTSLGNGIRTYNGQPSYWQNMTTYTVGYLIRPSGEYPDATSGLTFKQISDYQQDFLKNGYAASTKPAWPTGDLNSSNSDIDRVNDFIHAGFTGGGKGFSAQTAEDVRTIFSKILEDVLNSSGNDAGVAVSTSNAGQDTLTTRYKYGVEYNTLDNSGDVVAYVLDANGNVEKNVDGTPVIKWQGSTSLYADGSEDERNVFTISAVDPKGPLEFDGRFDNLPTDVQGALKQGVDADRIADDDSFIRYLRGEDGIADPDGKLFRTRSGKMAAMVNPPSTYMGGQSDLVYDLIGDIEGGVYYRGLTDRKRGYPASLFVATNAGQMHAMTTDTGVEMAAYMPRRSLKRMLHYAADPYSFQYVLDGPISQHDIYNSKLTDSTTPSAEKWKAWQHIAIGTGGRGEKLIYAIQSPINPASSGVDANRTPGLKQYLWETGPDQIDSKDDRLVIGHMTNPIRPGGQNLPTTTGYAESDGDWIVAINNGHYNGYEDTGENAGLVVLNANTGELIKNIPLPAGTNAGRGLSGVSILRDTDKTNRIVGAYAGDDHGNLWRFDLRGDSTNWKVMYGKPIFTTPGNVPIYGSPAWQHHPTSGFIVVAATGILLDETDMSDDRQQYIVGVWDPTNMTDDADSTFTTRSLSNMVEQSVTLSSATNGKASTSIEQNVYYKASKNEVDYTTKDGWYMKLGQIKAGERSIAEVQNFRTSVLISTFILNSTADDGTEMCTISDSPANIVYLLNAKDGAHTKALDQDGDPDTVEDYSVVYLPKGGFTRGTVLDYYITAKYEDPVADPAESTGGTDAPIDGTDEDPKMALNEDLRKYMGVNEQGGESREQDCGEEQRQLFGTADEVLNVYTTCAKAGQWSRRQYQISVPPIN